MDKLWLVCKISPGQFSGEFAVEGITFDGTGFSLFAPRDHLMFDGEPSADKPIDGLIEVSIGDSNDELCLVNLPRPTFENGKSVTVKRGQLQTA